MHNEFDAGRRRFLKTSAVAVGGLVIGFHLAPRSPRAADAVPPPPWQNPAPNAFVRIAADGMVTVLVNKSEMGQGVYTALPMILAEELDADWSRVRVEAAPTAPVYYHTVFGIQLTGGSTSVSSSWTQLRTVGATARAMLLDAAAERWGVPRDALTTEPGVVVHAASGRRAGYGELAAAAAGRTPPKSVALKDPKAFRLLGKTTPRLEGREKVTGESRFGLDVRLPEMLTAVVARPPTFGGRVKSFDAAKALTVPGVVKVKAVPSGVAVLARHTWAAQQGREALAVEWEPGPGAGLTTEAIRQDFAARAAQPGIVARKQGEPEAALEGATRVVEAVYELPYLAHAPMEPLNCTVHAREQDCEVWTGTQYQSNDQAAAAKILGLPPEVVQIHTQLLGGGFGRRATPGSDFVTEAVHVAKGESVPVKTVWLREDDIQGGYYRPQVYHKLTAGLDAEGHISAWRHTLVSQSIMAGTAFEGFLVKDGVDLTSVEGAADLPYAIPHIQVELHSPTLAVPVLWWRSVGHSHTAYAVEGFLDELAHATGRDPLALRRALLAEHPRLLRVLDLAAEKAGWGAPLPPGRGRGIAVRESFASAVAEVAEVSVNEAGELRVERVVCAIDCGFAVNPGHVEAQLESAIVLGLTAALYGEITLADGRVQQSNFHDYPPLRISEMPRVEVHIVPSDTAPTGVGEPGLPPIAPAVVNAVFAATGKRLRSLPLSHHDLRRT